MKLTTHFITAALLFSGIAAAQDNASKTKEIPKLPEQVVKVLEEFGSSEEAYIASVKKKQEYAKQFQALPEDAQKKYAEAIKKATKLSKEKRVAEALHAAFEARDIFENDTLIHNLIGSNYVEFRDFKLAAESFKKALAMDPYNPSIYFNLAEVYFVADQYEKSLELFTKLQKLGKITPAYANMRDLVNFKIELSHLGLSRMESTPDADKKKHREIFDKAVNPRTYSDHGLLTYYSKAAQAFANQDTKLAQKWLTEGQYVFSNRSAHMAWLDTMLEFGFIGNTFKENAFAKEITEKDLNADPANANQ